MRKIPPINILYKKISKNNLQKKSIETDELWYSRLIGRKISILFTWLFLRIGLTPNQATLIAFFTGTFGLFLLSNEHIHFFSIGFVLFHLYIVIDSSDGEMARFLDMTSKMGAFYDKLLHYLMKLGILIAMSIQGYHFSGNVSFIFFGLVLAIVSGFASTFYHLLPNNNTQSYSEQVRSQGYLIGISRKVFRALTGDIELSIVLFLLITTHMVFNYPIAIIIACILFSQLFLLMFYVVHQLFTLRK